MHQWSCVLIAFFSSQGWLIRLALEIKLVSWNSIFFLVCSLVVFSSHACQEPSRQRCEQEHILVWSMVPTGPPGSVLKQFSTGFKFGWLSPTPRDCNLIALTGGSVIRTFKKFSRWCFCAAKFSVFLHIQIFKPQPRDFDLMCLGWAQNSAFKTKFPNYFWCSIIIGSYWCKWKQFRFRMRQIYF